MESRSNDQILTSRYRIKIRKDYHLDKIKNQKNILICSSDKTNPLKEDCVSYTIVLNTMIKVLI